MTTHRPQRTQALRYTTPADIDATAQRLHDALAAMFDAYDRQKRSDAARRGWESRRRTECLRRAGAEGGAR